MARMLTIPPIGEFALVMTTTDTTVTPDAPDTPARHLLGWDCIEFWVGNARTTAGFLMSHFGFRCTGYAGPETGRRDKASYVLEQGDIRFVVSGALQADSPIADHVRKHGDGVHDLAWLVDDAAATYAAALARGARSVREPWVEHDDDTRGATSNSPRSPPTATRCTRSSTACATAARRSSRATPPRSCPTRASVRTSASSPSTTSSATSSTASSTRGSTSTPT